MPFASHRSSRSTTLRELAAVFLKLGTIGFGGPAAHIALMEDELVRRRAWITRDQFLDLIGAANLIPGPNSTEVAIHIGRVRGGLPGLIVAGAAFILPAFFIVLTIGWAYERYGKLPATTALLYGIKPVMIAIVVQALAGLGRTAIKSWPLAIAAAASLAAVAIWQVDEVVVLAIAAIGAAAIVWLRTRLSARAGPSRGERGSGTRGSSAGLVSIWPAFGASSLAPAVEPAMQAAALATPVTLWPLFLVFAKAGALLFGSGYVLLAFLRTDLVERLGWLTNAQLLDAIVVGQVTPGPVFTTATFIGYHLAGVSGAVTATVGIFLPAFVFVAISGPLIPVMRRSRVAGAVLDAVNVASLALMTAVTIALGRDALIDAVTIGIAAIAALLLFRYRVNATILIAAGAIVGLLLRR